MPHLRLEVPEEWLREEFRQATGFDAKKLLDRLVETLVNLRMPDPANAAETIPLINKSNLKHAIVPLYYAHTGGDGEKRFLHASFAAGNDTPGRTAEVRGNAARVLGEEIDKFMADLPVRGLASVTVWVQDIDRDRGYSTTAERKRRQKQ